MSEKSVIERQRNKSDGGSDHKGSGEQGFTIEIGNENLEFRSVEIADPVPTGRQIIKASGFKPAEEYLIFEISRDRRLNELELDQTTDVRGRRKERFLIFRSDRSWRGILDSNRFEWGAREISGHALKWLAGVDQEKYGIWLELRDEPDRLIADDEEVSLSPAGVERFRTDVLIRICVEDKIYQWPRDTITTEEISSLGGWDPSQGVIEVDDEQNERNLAPGEVVKLRPGLSFGKKLCFKRG